MAQEGIEAMNVSLKAMESSAKGLKQLLKFFAFLATAIPKSVVWFVESREKNAKKNLARFEYKSAKSTYKASKKQGSMTQEQLMTKYNNNVTAINISEDQLPLLEKLAKKNGLDYAKMFDLDLSDGKKQIMISKDQAQQWGYILEIIKTEQMKQNNEQLNDVNEKINQCAEEYEAVQSKVAKFKAKGYDKEDSPKYEEYEAAVKEKESLERDLNTLTNIKEKIEPTAEIMDSLEDYIDTNSKAFDDHNLLNEMIDNGIDIQEIDSIDEMLKESPIAAIVDDKATEKYTYVSLGAPEVNIEREYNESRKSFDYSLIVDGQNTRNFSYDKLTSTEEIDSFAKECNEEVVAKVIVARENGKEISNSYVENFMKDWDDKNIVKFKEFLKNYEADKGLDKEKEVEDVILNKKSMDSLENIVLKEQNKEQLEKDRANGVRNITFDVDLVTKATFVPDKNKDVQGIYHLVSSDCKTEIEVPEDKVKNMIQKGDKISITIDAHEKFNAYKYKDDKFDEKEKKVVNGSEIQSSLGNLTSNKGNSKEKVQHIAASSGPTFKGQK